MEDEYIVEEFSEDDYQSSSSEDDDVQTFLKREYNLLEVEDDFEAEVDKVMTVYMQNLQSCESSDSTMPSTSNSMDADATAVKNETAKNQDEINDELFYDPNMDEEDEKWVNSKRRSYIFPSKDDEKSKVKPLPNSDAVLNCPACLSLLCLDCQRHEIYKSQYRAMFVTNCRIEEGEVLKYPSKKNKFRKKSSSSDTSNEIYNPVKCSVCNTEVAVYDAEEIYHFFNVIASY